MNIVDIVRARAHDMSDAAALIEELETVSWAELHARIAAASWHLREHGVGEGDVVAISVRKGITYVVVSMAALRLGATYCGMDWRMRPGEYAAISAAIGPRLLVTDRPTGIAAGAAVLVVSEETWRLPDGKTAPAAIPFPQAPACLLLSSGTTGAPKAVALAHQASLWRGMMRANDLGLQRGMRVLHALPMPTSASAGGLMGQLLCGTVTIFHSPVVIAEELAEALVARKIDHVALVPTMVRGLLEVATGDKALLPDLAGLVTLGSAFHPEEKAEALRRITPRIYEHYGSTPTGPIARGLPADLVATPTSVGKPHSLVRIEIVDENDQPLAAGETGRIRVASPGNASGYVGDTGLHERNELIVGGWVYPGDLGRLDDEGRLFLEGRAGSVIIRGGQNLYPEEIERVLLAHPDIAEAAVAPRADERLGHVPVALLVLRSPRDVSEFLRHCRQNLQPHKVPAEFRIVDSLPKTANGKIRRADLPALVS